MNASFSAVSLPDKASAFKISNVAEFITKSVGSPPPPRIDEMLNGMNIVKIDSEFGLLRTWVHCLDCKMTLEKFSDLDFLKN